MIATRSSYFSAYKSLDPTLFRRRNLAVDGANHKTHEHDLLAHVLVKLRKHVFNALDEHIDALARIARYLYALVIARGIAEKLAEPRFEKFELRLVHSLIGKHSPDDKSAEHDRAAALIAHVLFKLG